MQFYASGLCRHNPAVQGCFSTIWRGGMNRQSIDWLTSAGPSIQGGWVECWWWHLSSMPLFLQVGGLAFSGPTHWRWLLWQYKPDLGRNWFGHLGEMVLCDHLLLGICSVYLCPLCVKLVWTTCWWPSLNVDSQLRIHHGCCGRVSLSLFYLKGREGCLTSWFLVVLFEGHDSYRMDSKETLS